MRPRLALLLGALTVPALPLLVAAPAHAAGTICVNVAVADCPAGASIAGNIPTAISQAASGTKILVGPGGYADGPYVLPAGVSIQGSGAGTGASATVLSLPAAGSQTYLTANGGTVSDLRVSMTVGNGATGIAATNGSIVDNVVVFGAGATGSTGISAQTATLQDATVNVTGGAGNTAVKASGTNTVLDSTWNGGDVGYDTTGTDSVSRVSIALAATAVRATAGHLAIDDSVLDLGTTGTAGLVARPAASSTATVTGGYLTVVGGASTARGVVADASGGGARTANVSLVNSIVRVAATGTALVSTPGAGTVAFSVTRSDFHGQQGAITDGGNNLDVDPAFVDPGSGNYALRAGSPVVDKGALAPGPSNDRDGTPRPFDGDRDGIPVPDMGAYELHDVTAPTTVFTGGPTGATSNRQPLFSFRSGPDAVFECQIDNSPFQPCTSPATTSVLPDGPHVFTVRAHDQVFNIEANPPKRSFTVDTVAPDTTLTKKAPKRFYKAQVKVKFASSESGVTFQCQLDGGPWRTCRSPFRYSVSLGKHTLAVRAMDSAGNVDATPVHEKFRRLRRPRPHHHHHH